MGLQMRVTLADVVLALAAHHEAQRALAAASLDTADFLEVPAQAAFDVTPEAATAFFRAKGLRATFSHADMIGEAHDHAFTVAKMMDMDLLAQVRASLDEALATGTPFGEWKQQIAPLLKKAGWWGEQPVRDPATGATAPAQLGSAWRLETIFRTNMQQAYAVEAWRSIVEGAELAPFLMYDAVDDLRTRAEHRSWDGTVLRWDHPWFKAHFPPCGFNCRCGVVQLSPDDLQVMGLSVSPEAPEDGTYRWRNPRTGMPMTVPKGVDPGFDRNPGAAYVAQLERLAREKISQIADPVTRKAAEAGMASVARKTVLGRAAALLADLADDVQRAGRLAKFMAAGVVDYVAALFRGAAPSAEQRAAFEALSQTDRRDIERRVEAERGAD